MKILYLIPQFPVPSETFVMREVSALRRLGVEVEVLAFEQPSSSQLAKMDSDGKDHFRRSHYLPRYPIATAAASFVRCGFSSLGQLNREIGRAATVKTNDWLRLARAQAAALFAGRGNFDHLHAHWPYASQIALLTHQMTGLPLSISVHAHEVEYDTGHFQRVFEKIAFAIFCNRAAMERLLSKLPASAREKSHLIYHGVDLKRFLVQPLPESTKPLRVISAGRLTQTKGFDRLVRACARYHAAGGSVKLTILGQGHMETKLRTVAEQSGFAPHLELPGWLPHDQIASRMAASHIFALMADTKFGDGLPNVVLEAMATARPVILSPLPAVHEAVTPGVEGFILRASDDETGFIEFLHQSAQSLDRLTEMGRSARRRMETGFDESLHAQQLLGLFQKQSAVAVAA